MKNLNSQLIPLVFRNLAKYDLKAVRVDFIFKQTFR